MGVPVREHQLKTTVFNVELRCSAGARY
jgi:hypothetical protein